MNRRRIAINGVIVLALGVVGAGTYASLAATRPVQLAAGQVVTVTRGTVVATVTASGNAKARSTVAQSLTSASGTVTKIYVHTGQQVKKGQRLLAVDGGDARDDVHDAQADLRSAQAQLRTASQGRTPAEQQQDRASVASAETSLANARRSLEASEDTADLDAKQQGQLVHRARVSRDDAEDATYATDDAKDSAVHQAETSYLQARQSRDATRLKDKQSVASAKGDVTAAQRSLSSQQATVAVNDQPADADTVASAQTAVDKDETALKQARATLADTTLKASVAGTVGTISAVKGQSSSSSGSGSSSATSSGSGASSATGSSTSSSSSSSSSGLVEIVDATHLQVTADVAEADIVKVHDGQAASVVFAASNKTVQGRVSAIDTTSTVTNNVVEYGVTITLDASAASLRVGQTATVTITTGTKKDALSVPTSALTRTGDRYTVLRRANAADSTVEVQTGLVGTTDTEITSGLAEGDQVVIVLSTASTSAAGGPRRGGGR
ncbi:MAG: HlyD family efflux transporter periplasmic adaptor subunit [Janthinobacterium lividum]